MEYFSDGQSTFIDWPVFYGNSGRPFDCLYHFKPNKE
jgi:hypothetical protein